MTLPAVTADARASTHETRVVSRASSALTVVDILTRKWRVIVVSAVVSLAAGVAWTKMQPTLYESSTTLVVSASEPTPGAQAAAITNARTLLENRRVAAAVIKQFQLDAPPQRLTPESLVRERLQISQIRDTNFLRVNLRLASPSAAAEALAALVQSGIDLNQQLNVENTIALAGGLIKKQLEEARRAMEKASDDLLAYQQKAQVDRLRNEAQTALAQRVMSAQVEADLAAERSRVAVAQRELAGRPRHLSAPRLATGEGPLLEHARRQEETRSVPADLAAAMPATAMPTTPMPAVGATTPKPEERRDPTSPETSSSSASRPVVPEPTARQPVQPSPETPPLGLRLADLYSDPVYEVLDYQAATGRTKLSALEAQRQVLRREAARDLFPRLYETELRLEKLRLEYELASQVYKDLVLRFESARKDVMGRSVNIQVADPPVTPLRPATPRLWLNVVIATALGIGGALLAVMLLTFTPRASLARI